MTIRETALGVVGEAGDIRKTSGDSLEHPPTHNPLSIGEGNISFKPSAANSSKDVSEEVSVVQDEDDFSNEPSPFSTLKGTSEGVMNTDGEIPTLCEEVDDKEGEYKGEQSGNEEFIDIVHEEAASKEGSPSRDDNQENKVF